MRKLESALPALQKRAEALSTKRATMQVELETAQTARQTHHLSGDIEDVKTEAALQQRVDSAESSLRGLDVAITALTVQVTEAEATLNKERNAAANKASSEALARKVDLIEAKLTPWLAGARELYKLLEELGVFRFEVGRVGDFVLDASNQVEVAMSVALPDLRAAVVAVAEGREQLPKIAPALTVVPPQPSPTEWVFLINPIAWTSDDGVRHRAPRHDFVALPPIIAARARACGAAVPIADPRTKHRVQGQALPELHHCRNLDVDGAPMITAEPRGIRPQRPRTEPPFGNNSFAVERPKAAASRALPRGFEPHPDFADVKPRRIIVDPMLTTSGTAKPTDEA